jgi:sarcosine oxidase subunit alpha
VTQAYRLPAGGRVDRTRLLSFSFNGRSYTGCYGDTLASALLANGVHLVGRSFKYHRPRGILSAGSEEPNALVQLGDGVVTDPNMRATQIELYDGLRAASQNCWPSVNFDIGALNNVFSRLLPAGFYYKTFMWPRRLWKRYEFFIRHIAGLGRAPSGPDPDEYDKMHVHCDVLVVGAGAAGLAAALVAGRAGARVIIADEQAEFGGALLGGNTEIEGKPALEWVERALTELSASEQVRTLPRSTVTGYYDHNYLIISERVYDHMGQATGRRPRQRLWKVRAKQVVLATGAHERPLVFHNNDRPGVMLASAVQTYVNRYAVKPGNEALVFTNNDSAYGVAFDLTDAGIRVSAIVDVRASAGPGLRESARERAIEVLSGHAVASVSGNRRLRSAQIKALDGGSSGTAGSTRSIGCDLLCMSGGWNPTVHLYSQSRGTLVYDRAKACFVPGESVQAERSAGAANGSFTLERCLAEGHAAGVEATAQAGFKLKKNVPGPPRVAAQAETTPGPLWIGFHKGRIPSKQFVDFQNDVTTADIALAAREGYRSVEHLKRYTTLGMGTDQGKTGNINALAILAQTLNADISALGTTTFRPPFTPITFGVLAGRDVGELADPVRMTPMHHWHEINGARFEDVGQWKRPWYYPHDGETMHDAVNRECLTVRNAVGILDASTLGKIDIQGADAAELLNRVYTNNWMNLPIGSCRYGMMCGEDGMVFDDGVTVRIGEQQYWMSTTTGNAARVLAWLEEWLQTEWPELKVYCNSMTEHWATATIAGPLARELLSTLTDDINLDASAFPFMTHRAGTVAGIPAQVFRISFTGELSYEINVPAHYGMALWNALMTAGEEYDITPYGTETMHVLRAEKGYIIAGQDTDGTVTPIDLGMEAMVSKRKDFIGKRSLSRSDMQRDDRKQLVGLLTIDPHQALPEGGQIVIEPWRKPPLDMIGHVTSSYHSANVGRPIALALIKGGRKRYGETVHVPIENKAISAVICEPVFFDPEGGRLRG